MATKTENNWNGNTGIPGCIRKMSRYERLFLMSPACTVMMAARITGTVDEARFRQALDAASRKHPLLSAKIIFDRRHEAWFSSDAVPLVPLRVVPRVSEHQWLDELKGEARVPFDLAGGPLIKCVLLQSPEVSDLIIFCNHSICDGMALAGLVRDLLSLYEDPAQEVRALEPPDVANLQKGPGLSLQVLVARLFAAFANRKWMKNPYYFGPAEYAALYRAYWEGRKPGLVLFEFDPEESARLLAVCRGHGVTVGSALAAACLAAHNDIAGGFSQKQQALMVPYDMRRRAKPVEDVFCFCAGGLQFPLTYSPEKQFWDNAAALHRAIHTRLENPDPSEAYVPDFEPSLIDALSAFSLFVDRVPGAYARTEVLQRFIRDTGNMVFSFNRNYERDIPGFVPSNLGKVDIPESSDGIRLDRLVFLPSASELNPLVLGGIGAGGRTIFSLPFVDPPAKTGISPEPEMIRIRNRALEYLGFPEKVHPGATEMQTLCGTRAGTHEG